VSGVRELLRVSGHVDLASLDPASTPGTKKATAKRDLGPDEALLEQWQEKLTAEKKRSVLLVLQGMDTSGKDGTVKHVVGAIDPQGCRLVSFKQPTDEELARDFLWRVRNALPRPGEIGVFNRSHYEDVLVARVHGLVPPDVWHARYDEINAFEEEIASSGTTIVKVFLHISRDEQARRLIARLDDPTKRWKFNAQDLAERARWDEYTAAYEDVLRLCPGWYVVPADHKWYRNWAIARLLIETLEELRPGYPDPALDIEALKEQIRGS
jgi:PPK2 family polyphosphate:nucleotide phosphotransferase